LSRADKEDEDDDTDDMDGDSISSLLEALVALGPDVYRRHAVAVAEWARRYIERRRAYMEKEREWGSEIIEDKISHPARQIIQSLGMDAAPYARELVVLTWYHTRHCWTECEMEEENFLPRRLFLSRCRTLRLVAEFGDRCPETAVSALLDQVLSWTATEEVHAWPVSRDERDWRLEAHVFSTLRRLGPDRLAPHADRIIANVTNPPEFRTSAVELVAALPDGMSRAPLLELIRSDDPRKRRAAARSRRWRIDDVPAGLFRTIQDALAEGLHNSDDDELGFCRSVAGVEAKCARELGLTADDAPVVDDDDSSESDDESLGFGR